MIHSSLYLPERIYEALRKIAFEERVKIHDLAMEGIDGVYGVGAYHLKAGRTGLVRPVLTMTEKKARAQREAPSEWRLAYPPSAKMSMNPNKPIPRQKGCASAMTCGAYVPLPRNLRLISIVGYHPAGSTPNLRYWSADRVGRRRAVWSVRKSRWKKRGGAGGVVLWGCRRAFWLL